MALSKVKKAKSVLLFYQIASAICAILVVVFLFQTFQYVTSQRQKIENIQAQAKQVQADILASTEEIQLIRDETIEFIPANFTDFLDPVTTNSDFTRMFDQLANEYRSTGETFFIRSINYGSQSQVEESQLQTISANLSLETSKNNLLAFLRDIEKTGLSSDRAFYILDPQSLSFSNLTSEDPEQQLNVDLKLNIILRK